jgi:hypothetical protein
VDDADVAGVIKAAATQQQGRQQQQPQDVAARRLMARRWGCTLGRGVACTPATSDGLCLHACMLWSIFTCHSR